VNLKESIVLASRTFAPVRKIFTSILKAAKKAKYLAKTNKRLGKEERFVMNAKRERAKSKIVDQTEVVLQFGQEFLVNDKLMC